MAIRSSLLAAAVPVAEAVVDVVATAGSRHRAHRVQRVQGVQGVQGVRGSKHAAVRELWNPARGSRMPVTRPVKAAVVVLAGVVGSGPAVRRPTRNKDTLHQSSKKRL